MDRMVTLRIVAQSIHYEPMRHAVCIDVVLRGSDTEEGKEEMEQVRGRIMSALDIIFGGSWVSEGAVQEAGTITLTTAAVQPRGCACKGHGQ